MTATLMAREIREIPDVARAQLAIGLAHYRAIGEALRKRSPTCLVTCARGTSDHAATYLKYLVETRLGIPVASIGPSVASIYGTPLLLKDAALVAVSQSGASPDLVALIEVARRSGALTVALTNVEPSPAAGAAELSALLMAGEERAVAASKSYIASLVAIAAIVAEWARDQALAEALHALPDALAAALRCDWTPALEPFREARSVFCLSRGAGLTIAAEAALKLKETCAIHAEAFSAAEVMHGPLALAGPDLVALSFVPSDETRPSVIASAERLLAAGTPSWIAGATLDGAVTLPTMEAPHPALTPICQAVSFYVFVESLARLRGRNPDKPLHLKKVTQTV